MKTQRPVGFNSNHPELKPHKKSHKNLISSVYERFHICKDSSQLNEKKEAPLIIAGDANVLCFSLNDDRGTVVDWVFSAAVVNSKERGCDSGLSWQETQQPITPANLEML